MSSLIKLDEKLGEALSKREKKNFIQSVELIINLKDVDVSKPEKRFTETIELPRGLDGKPRKIAVIASGAIALEASRSTNVDKVFEKPEVEALIGNKKAAKKIAREYDYFLVEPSLMPIAARALGAALGSLGKSPVPIPPNINIDSLASRYKRSITVRLRKIPQVSCMIGTEDMHVSELMENANEVINRVVEKLEKKWANIKSIYIKTTMGQPIKLDISRVK